MFSGVANKFWFGLVPIFLLVLFFSTYKLTESPPTWMDEGLIIQPAKNLVEIGVYKFQIAPNTFVSPYHISTSYPVTFPIALSFKVFGTGLLQARVVMVLYLLAFIVAIYTLARKYIVNWFYALVLIASFPPLYGNGKNVLGEVPGLFFLVSSLYFFYELSHSGAEGRINKIIGLGLSAGLCVATKPIFILLLPALFIAFIYYYLVTQSDSRLVLGEYVMGLIWLSMPLALWFAVQFSGDSLSSVLQFYLNPHNTNSASTVFSQLMSFVTDLQPMYFLFLFAVWLASLIRRFYIKTKISNAEVIGFVFASLVLLAYLRTPPYYRYFFPAEILCLLYLPQSVDILWPKGWSKKIFKILLIMLVLVQCYQLNFRSWVANSYSSIKTAVIEQEMGNIIISGSVFVYEAPELVTFLDTHNYYQYSSSGVPASVESLKYLADPSGNNIDYILTKTSFINEPLFTDFHIVKEFASYVLMEHNDSK